MNKAELIMCVSCASLASWGKVDGQLMIPDTVKRKKSIIFVNKREGEGVGDLNKTEYRDSPRASL